MCDMRCCHSGIIFVLSVPSSVLLCMHSSRPSSIHSSIHSSRLSSIHSSSHSRVLLGINTHRRTGGIHACRRRWQADQAGQACHVQPVGYLLAVSSAGGVAAGRPCLGAESVVDAGFCAVLAGDGLLWRPGHAACAVGFLAALSSTQVGYLLVVGFLGGGRAGWQCLSCVALGNEGFFAVVAGGGSLW